MQSLLIKSEGRPTIKLMKRICMVYFGEELTRDHSRHPGRGLRMAPLHHSGLEPLIENIDVTEGLLVHVGIVPGLTLNLCKWEEGSVWGK